MNTEDVYIVQQILREILHGSHNIHDTYIKTSTNTSNSRVAHSSFLRHHSIPNNLLHQFFSSHSVHLTINSSISIEGETMAELFSSWRLLLSIQHLNVNNYHCFLNYTGSNTKTMTLFESAKDLQIQS